MVTTQLDTLKLSFRQFEEAHHIYHETLTDESNIKTSDEYLSLIAEGNYIVQVY